MAKAGVAGGQDDSEDEDEKAARERIEAQKKLEDEKKAQEEAETVLPAAGPGCDDDACAIDP